MVFRPLVVTRYANTAPGICLALVGIPVMGIDFPAAGALVPGFLIVVAAAVLVVRGYRLAVHLERDDVTVYGFLTTRTIPRRSVVEVTYFPALRWTDGSGRARWTPLIMFKDNPGMLRSIQDHNEYCLAELRSRLERPRRRVR